MSDGQKQTLTIVLILGIAVLLCAGLVAGALFLFGEVREVTNPTPPTLAPDNGVLITAVLPNSSAAQANLQPGHVILRLDDQPITSTDLLMLLLANMEAGTEFSLLVRNEAGELRQTTAVRAAEPPYLGVEIADLPLETPNPTTANATPTAPLVTQLPIVSGIVPGSPAAEIDVQVGDVITAVDGQAILNGEELLNQMAAKAPGETITLMLRRGEETLVRTAVLAPHPDNPQRGFLGINISSSIP
jgi:S1-C subfamily serine protease